MSNINPKDNLTNELDFNPVDIFTLPKSFAQKTTKQQREELETKISSLNMDKLLTETVRDNCGDVIFNGMQNWGKGKCKSK